MTDLSRDEAELYYQVLHEMGGGYGREIQAALGTASGEVFDEIRKRLLRRAESDPDATGLDLDGIDWAAIRAVAPIVLSTIPESEFRIVTGKTLDEVEALLAQAQEKFRHHEYRRGYVSHQRGTCVVRLPATALRQNVRLAGVPDSESWDRVVPECARGRRDEFLDAMKALWSKRVGEWHWEERSVESMDELESWVRGRHLEWHVPGP